MKGLYEKRGWFYFQPPTPKGGVRPPATALKTQDYLTAVTNAIRIRDMTEMEHHARRMTLEEILPRYYRDKNEHKKSTRHSRVRILTGFQEILGNPRVDQIDPDMLARWWDHLGTKGGCIHGRGIGMRPTSKKSYLLVVRAFINWAIAEGMIKGDPLKRLRVHTRVQSSRIHEFLTEDDRETLLAAARDKPDHLQLVLHLGFFAGLRDAEMLAMKKDWIWISPEGDRGSISVQDTPILYQHDAPGVWQPKGKRTRVIPMHSRLLEFIVSYGLREPYMLAPEKDRWPDDKTRSKRFDQKKALANLGKRHGLKLNHHILRHSFATHLAMKGVTLAQIAGLLGDGLRVTEEHYAGFSPSKTNPLEVL